MAFLKHGSILIGPGGRLPDIPDNQELFSRLQEAPELTSEELLRLAEFYKAYPTNASLGEHLALVALTKLERHRGAKGDRVLQKIVFSQHYDAVDVLERNSKEVDSNILLSGGAINDESSQSFDDFRLFIRHLSTEGLLIETLSGKNDGKDVTYHFVIGFSPAPSELWHE